MLAEPPPRVPRLEATTGTSYDRPRVERWRRALWLVLAAVGLSAAGCMGGDDEAQPQPPSTVDSAGEIHPPSDFAAKATAFKVVLSWTPPAGDYVERYALFRDGAALTTIAGTAATYTDEDVVPGLPYSYEIESRRGDVVSDRVATEAETAVPPLRSARLDGTFNITTTFVRKMGYGDYQHPNFGWRFDPQCPEGPCTVAVRDIHDQAFRVALERNGARYTGTYTGQFTIECGNSRSISTVTLDLHVDAAEAVGEEWLATRLSGSMKQSEAAQLGCQPAEATFSVHGRLVR